MLQIATGERARRKRIPESVPVAWRLLRQSLPHSPSQIGYAIVDTEQVSLLSNAMTAYAKRRRALSGNLANVDTPGYDRTSVSFEEELQDAREAPLGTDQSEVEGEVVVEDEKPVLENELMALSDTQMRTQHATRALSHHFDLMRTGITGRSS